MSKMSAADLKAMLAAEKADALAAMSAARLSEERADAMDYYLGDMGQDMPAPEGRSRAVSTDVADTIEGLMPSLMDIFCGADEVVRFEPVGAEDEAAAQQETDYVNHVFMQQNPGFMVMYSFIKDALLSKVGIVKVWWDEREQESARPISTCPTTLSRCWRRPCWIRRRAGDRRAYRQDAAIRERRRRAGARQPASNANTGRRSRDAASPAQRIRRPRTMNMPPLPAALVTPPTRPRSPRCHDPHHAHLAQARVMGVPPEEFGIERGARSIKRLQLLLPRVVTKTESALIAQGFDADADQGAHAYTGPTEIETLARDTVQEHFRPAPRDAIRRRGWLRITEHYVRMDYEGTGQARLYQVTPAAIRAMSCARTASRISCRSTPFPLRR